MGPIVIYGPPRTGKTFHKEAFAAHFGCDRVIDFDDDQHRKQEIGAGALVLMQQKPRPMAASLANATVYSIEQARALIGIGPVSSIPAVGEPRPRTLRPPEPGIYLFAEVAA
jgi:hypothetical protein